MPKLNREMLRQMIAEEIAKTENTEPEAVKVSADQLRNIIMNEVRLISEQDTMTFDVDVEDSAQLKVRTIDDVLKTGVEFKGNSNDPYGYAVDDEGVYVISKGGKNLKSAMRLDPRDKKGALAIRTLARANRKNKEVMNLMSSENDFLQVASKTLGKQAKPEKAMQLIAQIEQGLGKALNQMSAKEMVANSDIMKARKDALKDPKFNDEVDFEFGSEDPTEKELELLLPKLRKLKK